VNKLEKPTLSSFPLLPPIDLQQYHHYLPTAFDESLSLVQKMNKVMQQLSTVGEITNGVITKWNEVMEWILNNGLEDVIIQQLLDWYNDGTLGEIINEAIFEGKADKATVEALTLVVDGHTTSITTINSYLKHIEIDITKPPYNALPNTDIGSILTQALTDLSGAGGTIKIPSGDYIINASVDLKSNIIIKGDKGTILRKTVNATEGYMFTVGRTSGTTGYGGGGKNIIIENIQFEGYVESPTTGKALALSFNHAENLTIRNCRFLNCMTQDHAIDLAGCNRVFIEKCSFEGSYQVIGREYNEAIQIDSSVPQAMPQFINYDGLPTKDVIVRDCQFIPSYYPDGNIFNYAPNPIGNHGYTGGKHYEGIVFENNLVLDGWGQSGNDSTDWYAWIHFYGLKDSKFINNRIIATKGQNATALGFYSSSNGRYDPITLVSGSGEPVNNTNVQIIGNTIQGFNHADTTGGIIRAHGINYNGIDYKVGNFVIEDNQFDNNSVGISNDSNVGRALIHISLFSNVRVVNNKSDNSRTFVLAYDGQYLTVSDNQFHRSAMGGITLTNINQIQIHNNIGENLRQPLSLLECYDVVVDGNIFTNIQPLSVNDVFDYSVRLRNLNNLQMKGNIIRTFGSTIEYGIYLYQTEGTSKNLYVFDNIFEGFVTSNVTTTGTLTNYLIRNS
jgi:hypothetical protein